MGRKNEELLTSTDETEAPRTFMHISAQDVDNAPEPQCVGQGRYLVTLEKITAKLSKKKQLPTVNIMLVIDNPDGETPLNPVFHQIMLPNDADTKEWQKRRLLDLKHFCNKFDISKDEFFEAMNAAFDSILAGEVSEVSLDEFKGGSAEVLLGYDPEDEEEGYAEKNTVKSMK